MSSPTTEFIHTKLYPPLFERIDQAFPDMGFRRMGKNWLSPKRLDGSTADRKDKCKVSAKYPHRIKEQGGDSLTLIDFQMRRANCSFEEALRTLCAIVGEEPPEKPDTEEYREYKEKLEAMETAAQKMQQDLFGEKGREVLDYLRNVRGYSDELIKEMGLGCIDEATAIDLNRRSVVGLTYGIGKDYPLAIPYVSAGVIKGFKFRAIDSRKDKYRNSNGLPKRASLFGLVGIRLTGNKEKDRDITIVEGELDALHAQAIGIWNVVAAAGGEISDEALKEAKNLGVERVTILFDTEGSTEGQRNTDKKKAKAIEAIYKARLTPFVAELPSPDGGKMDVDSYLKDHTKEELCAIIDKALSAPLYLYQQELQRAIERQGGEGEECTLKNISEFKARVIAIANSPHTAPTDRDMMFAEFAEATGHRLSKESLQEEADRDKAKQDAARQTAETRAAIADATAKLNAGDTAGAIEVMHDRSSDLRTISREAEYAKMLVLPTREGILANLREQPDGVPTPYFFFGQGNKEQQLLLPSAALTFICAPTSHGKSTMLRNLALYLAQNGQEGAVVYLTLEETVADTTTKLLNTYIGEGISANNLRTIKSYNKSGKWYGSSGSSVTVEAFKQRREEFMSLLTSGKLLIFHPDNDTADLVSRLRYLHKQVKTKAIFIDYVQLLKKRNSKLQRREELGEIAADFMELSTSLQLPIIMAAQLNRDAKCPIEMHNQNIAEAADIERSANAVICLWNSAFLPNVKSAWTNTDKDKDTEQKRLESLGLTLGQAGKLYGKLTKYRDGEVGLDAVFAYRGNEGIIIGNAPKPSTTAETAAQDVYRNLPF